MNPSAETRYRVAIRKSAILANRAVRKYLAGETSHLGGDFDRACIIKAIQRAYEAGVRDAARVSEELRAQLARSVPVEALLAAARVGAELLKGEQGK